MKLKNCKDCKIEKAQEDFYGRSAICKPCHNQKTHLNYKNNKTILLAWQKSYNEKNSDKIKLYKKEHWQKNKFKYSTKKKANYFANKPLEQEKRKLDYQKNKVIRLAKQKEWRENHVEQQKLYKKTYVQQKPEIYRAINSKRRAAKLQRIPKWLTKSDWIEIKWAYTEAKRLTQETGILYQVDHIIPLQGKNISGLHCPQNLQIITKKENNLKANTYPYIRE